MDKPTLISAFYNEEYLLPYWINHHKKIFDKALLINWHSTDGSEEIIRKLAPDWKIVNTKNKNYTRANFDAELIDNERMFAGWKMILQTSEFIFHPNLTGYLEELSDSIDGVWLPPISLIDVEPESPLDPATPLILQKTFGTIGKNMVRPTNRLIHKMRDGQYKGEGRHDSHSQKTFIASDIFHVWAGWCPWNEKFRNRKLQQLDNCEDKYKSESAEKELGYHLINQNQLQTKYQNIRNNYASDLFLNPTYKFLYQEIEKSQGWYGGGYKIDFKFSPENQDFGLSKIQSYLKAMKVDSISLTEKSDRSLRIDFNLLSNKFKANPYFLIQFTKETVGGLNGVFNTLLGPRKYSFIIIDEETQQPIFDSKVESTSLNYEQLLPKI